ncbi:hypothetical protein [Candidatus Coxiella mudrowiae]|uniref:hypothetical protein n=1 Tax=Candidatus Coxiella mudrowiae TaxID=2054173 RepID=UPI0006627291|nr:hypothetical protein [Candidatus Coxiella mudrowiae]
MLTRDKNKVEFIFLDIEASVLKMLDLIYLAIFIQILLAITQQLFGLDVEVTANGEELIKALFWEQQSAERSI